jgi:hypothetical protein
LLPKSGNNTIEERGIEKKCRTFSLIWMCPDRIVRNFCLRMLSLCGNYFSFKVHKRDNLLRMHWTELSLMLSISLMFFCAYWV